MTSAIFNRVYCADESFLARIEEIEEFYRDGLFVDSANGREYNYLASGLGVRKPLCVALPSRLPTVGG